MENWTNWQGRDKDDNQLVWDLRQIYAQDLVGQTLKLIMIARMSENFVQWYNLLKRDLYTEIYQKLTEQEIKDLDKLVEETKEVLVKYAEAYLKKNSDAYAHEQVTDALCNLERKMRRLMDLQHKMFGQSEYFDEDEI